MLSHRLRMLQRAGTAAIFSDPGDFIFSVPMGVTSLSMLCLGAGGDSETVTNVPVGDGAGGGGGGGLSYSNSVAVTPGETLNIRVGYPVNSALKDSRVVRASNSDTLVYANGGAPGILTAAGVGGSVSGASGAVKYAGGNGAAGSSTEARGGGGGSAATTAASGATAIQATVDGGGRGASLSVVWTLDAYTINSSTNLSGNLLGSNSLGAGGGGGGGVRITNSPATKGAGGNGLVILLWAGRVFSSGTAF